MIHFLVKVFAEEEHAVSFLRGDMFANRLSWFKKIEATDGRGDQYEGAVVLQPDNLVIQLNATDKETGEVLQEFTFTKDDLAAPPIVQPEHFDALNLFCMYAAHSYDFKPRTEDPLQELKRHIEIPEDCLKLGRYAVVITNAPEFLRRIQAAANQERYCICRGLMKYYDPEVGTPLEPLSIEAVFRKREEFAYQREYRFVMDTGTTGTEAITLNIGGIADIAMLLNTCEINQQLSMKLAGC